MTRPGMVKWEMRNVPIRTTRYTDMIAMQVTMLAYSRPAARGGGVIVASPVQRAGHHAGHRPQEAPPLHPSTGRRRHIRDANDDVTCSVAGLRAHRQRLQRSDGEIHEGADEGTGVRTGRR